METELGEHTMLSQQRSLLFAVVFVIAISTSVQGADPVYFADPNLKAAVEGQYLPMIRENNPDITIIDGANSPPGG